MRPYNGAAVVCTCCGLLRRYKVAVWVCFFSWALAIAKPVVLQVHLVGDQEVLYVFVIR